jgi:hypothetical protein
MSYSLDEMKPNWLIIPVFWVGVLCIKKCAYDDEPFDQGGECWIDLRWSRLTLQLRNKLVNIAD